MAYSSTNPPVMVWGGFGGSPMRGFAYASTHTVAAVAASSFFSDGYARGMRPGDRVYVNQMTTASPPAYTAHATGVVSASSSGAGATVVFTATST